MNTFCLKLQHCIGELQNAVRSLHCHARTWGWNTHGWPGHTKIWNFSFQVRCLLKTLFLSTHVFSNPTIITNR